MDKTQSTVMAAILAGGLFVSASANANIVFSYEAAGVENTTVAGAVTETFNSAPIGIISTYHSDTIGGTYSSGQIIAANQYGGAGGSQYDVTGLGNTTSQSLTFDAAKTYFGMWWSAGDAANVLEFYSGGSLVATFDVNTVTQYLTSDYLGNPDSAFLGQDPNEYFVYLNFTGTDGTTFDQIVFNNATSSGFESDNHSVYDKDITKIPGTVVGAVPEPSTVVAGALLLLPFGLHGFRYLRNRKQVA
jgi:hypothetical protein